MAEITHPDFPDIVIDTGTGLQGKDGFWTYQARKGGGNYFDLPSSTPFGPEALEAGINNPGTDVPGNVAALLKGLQFSEQGRPGIVKGTILPAIHKTPANILGLPMEAAQAMAHALLDTPINLVDWAFGGFEGDMPGTRHFSTATPFGGVGSIARGMQNVGDWARRGQEWTEEAGWYVEVPNLPYNLDLGLGGTRWGAGTPLNLFTFTTDIDESTKARRYASLITQIIGAAPVEGALIANMAIKLARTTKNPTTKHVYEAISELHAGHPLAAAAAETAMGAAVGGGMVTSISALEAAWPNAPQWAKNTVMAGGGLLLPVGAMTAASMAWDIGIKTPVIRFPLRVLAGMMESVTLTGAQKAAARALQSKGGDWKDRHEMLGVIGQFRLALIEGRNMDPATRIAFTTPQLFRNEARLLEAKLDAAAPGMPRDEVDAQRKLIEDIRMAADFQEGQLKTLSTDDGVGAEAYAKYSGRMMDRRDSIFSAFNDAILKLDLGGRSDAGVGYKIIQEDYDLGLATGAFEFNTNRMRAFQEGHLELRPEQIQDMSKAFDAVLTKMEEGSQAAIADAERRVAAIRDGMPENISAKDRQLFNMWIRREIETAYQEVDAMEDLLWHNISGLNRPKTESYFTPDGDDLGPQILIDGVPIGEHFAAKAAALKGGEPENQSKWLWKLSGRDALIDQAAKGGGPNAEKIARQNVVIKNNERIVAQRQQELDAASAKFKAAGDIPYESTAYRNAMARVRQLEAELEAVPAHQTPRINSTRIKLEGARAKVVELLRAEAVDPNLTRAETAFNTAQTRLNDAQIKLDTARDNIEISLSKGVDHEGNPVNLDNEIVNRSVLDVQKVGGVLVGREAQELQNIISHLKAELSFEDGRPNRKPAKITAIGDLIDDLERAIADPENFSVDTIALDAARRMTDLKHGLFTKGAVGELRARTTRGEAKVPPEKTIEKIAPTTGQETNLRQLETALAGRHRLMTGQGTPFRMTTGKDGKVVPELDRDFNLQKYSEAPPAPFEAIRVDGGRSLGFRLAEGTQPTPVNIEMVQRTLWDRFKGFGTGDKFSSTAAARWIENNDAAIRWLREATGKDTGFEDLANAKRIVEAIRHADISKLDDTVRTLRKNGAFNEDFTEEGYRLLVREAAQRESNLQSAAIFLDNPEPLTIGTKFLAKFRTNPEVLRNTLKVLESGVLPDGSNPALEGFRQAVAEGLIREALTKPGSSTNAGKVAEQLSAHLGTTVTLWDPQALLKLAKDPIIRRLLGEMYGEAAPKVFGEIAEAARLQSPIGPAATPGVKVRTGVSDTWAGFIGRWIGGVASDIIPLGSPSKLWAPATGRQLGMEALADVRGSSIDRLLVDLLMEPELAVVAMEKFPVSNPQANALWQTRLRLYAHQKFIGDNARRIQQLRNVPGVLYEVGEPTKYQEFGDDEEIRFRRGPRTSLREPTGTRPRRVASNVPPNVPSPRAPVDASVLSRVSPVGQQPMPVGPRPTGPVSQETLAGLSQVGLPLFANYGGHITAGAGSGVGRNEESGIMSVRCKPRQIVG